jgi:hypothetical protein
MQNETDELLSQFECGTVDPTVFDHKSHVRVAYALLRRDGFIDALITYARCLRSLTEKAGVPEKFNVTITVAYLSLIAERLHGRAYADFEDFITGNGDLLSPRVVMDLYSDTRMKSPLARGAFLLPDRPAA